MPQSKLQDIFADDGIDEPPAQGVDQTAAIAAAAAAHVGDLSGAAWSAKFDKLPDDDVDVALEHQPKQQDDDSESGEIASPFYPTTDHSATVETPQKWNDLGLEELVNSR